MLEQVEQILLRTVVPDSAFTNLGKARRLTNRGFIANALMAVGLAGGGLMIFPQEAGADTPTPTSTPTARLTPVADCLVRVAVKAEFVRSDGSIIGTAPNRRYLVEAIGQSAVMTTNNNGVGIAKAGTTEVPYAQFRGKSDAKKDGKDAIGVRVQSLNSGESTAHTAVCGTPLNLDKKVIVGPNMIVTPGTGPTFEPRGRVVDRTPAAETPTRVTTASPDITVVRTATSLPTRQPDSTPSATASPVSTSEATPNSTPSATPAVPAARNSGPSGPDLRFVGEAAGNVVKTVRESLLPGALAGVVLIWALVNKPYRWRERVWNAARYLDRRVRYGASGAYPRPFRVI